MESVECWVSEVLSSVRIPRSVVTVVLEKGPNCALKELQKTSAQEPVGPDMYGVFSTAMSSARKRRAFVLSLPSFTTSLEELDLLWKWVKVLSTSRYRLLRAAVVLAVCHCVESLLELKVPPSEMKQAYVFCGRVSQQILVVRARDTFSVVRQIVADYIVKWYRVNNQVFTSSVFSAQKGELMNILLNLMCDEDINVRGGVVQSLLNASPPLTISPDNVNLVVNLLLIKCSELFELIENGNPPYLDLLRTEIVSLSCFVKKIIVTQPEVVDGASNRERVYQLLWSPIIPLEARKVIAQSVSLTIFAEDFLSMHDSEKMIKMISEFISEYRDNMDGSEFVWESFFACFENLKISEIKSLLLNDFEKLHILGEVAKGYQMELDFVRLFNILSSNTKDVTNILSCMLLFEPAEIPAPDLVATVLGELVMRTNLSYRNIYLAYQVWDKLARVSVAVFEQLDRWCIELSSHLTLETLTNIHAMESVIQRPVADQEAMAKLLDFATTGAITSIPLIVCAIDLAFIQTLKQSSPDLMQKLTETLTFLLNEAKQDNSDDALTLQFFCEYRLDHSANPKDRSSIFLQSVDPSIKSLNEYIICNILDNKKLSSKITSLAFTIRE